MLVSEVRAFSFCFLYAYLLLRLNSGAATTASRLGQPDLAIATLNDFVEVRTVIFGLAL